MHLRIIQKVTERHAWKVRYQGTTESSHIVHCTRALREVLMLKYKTVNMGNSITCTL